TSGSNAFPVWSADSQTLMFQSTRDGDEAIWSQRADGSQPATRVTRPERGRSHIPESSSPDGRHLLFDEVDGNRVSILDLSLNDHKIASYSSMSSETPSGAVFSRDGLWVAYAAQSTSTQSVVFVEPYPATGARYEISKDQEDGHHPVWSPDGHE